MALCRAAGFARVVFEHQTDRRAGATCYRRFEAPPENPTAPVPRIHAAVNNRTSATHFNPAKDEYICLYFVSSQPNLTRDQIRVEIDGYGVPVLLLSRLHWADEWQANLKVPPFLSSGVHQIRVRTAESAFSNVFSITVRPAPPREVAIEFRPAAELTEAAPEIYAIRNNLTGASRFRGYKKEYLCARFRSSEASLTRQDVAIQVAGRDVAVVFLMDVGDGRWQADSRLPDDIPPGTHPVRVRTARSPFSNAVEIQFEPD
jgi:hypothetical protein